MSARITDPEQLKELLGIPFTPEQTACITAPPAPQVIVAGAGSGKTTVMAARVVWLVGTGQVAPEQVLGLTFTNKAAAELADRVRTALVRAGVTDPDVIDPDDPPGEPGISTYHAFAGRLLTDHGLRLGLEPTSRLLADATRYQLAARVLREAPGPYPALTKSFSALVSDLLALDAELAEHLVAPEELRAHDSALLSDLEGVRLGNADLRKVPDAAAARRELLDLVVRYRDAKRSRDLLDFGDQIALSARLALTRPEVGRILRDEFRVVLLDEYQDTSVAQRLLLSGLFGRGAAPDGRPGEGTGHPVTAVGDPCQAIYGWRGASVANLDDFPEHFPHADGRPATRFSLSENRRSGGRLLDLANGLAEPLRARHEGVEALRPAPGAERDGSVRIALLPTHAEEIGWLADSIAHLVRTGKEPGEIAVLCRTAGDFAAIQGALVARDVPVEVVGLSGLLHLPEVADLVAVCEVLQDPGANAPLVRLLTGPRWRIGARDLALLGRRARLLVHRAGDDDADADQRLAAAVEGTDPAEVVSLADALDTFLEQSGPDDGLPFSAEARVRFARLATELRDLRRSLADPLMDVLHRVLATTGLEVELSASPHALAARRRETLAGFLDVAASFAALDGEATLLAFLGFLRTAEQYEKGLDNALPGGENTVKVLTAHKSKGLEWDVVVVPGLVADQFPSTRSRESWTSQAKVLPHALRGDSATLPGITSWDAKGLKAFKEEMKEHQHTEELRLGYVTFTRPRSLLLGSAHWWGPTQKRRRGPSAFLEALYDHCAAGFGEIEAWAEEPEEDAENPALHAATAVQAWPLPLDPTATARRREAADTVLAHLSLITGPGDATAPGRPGAVLHGARTGPHDREGVPFDGSGSAEATGSLADGPSGEDLWPEELNDPADEPWPDEPWPEGLGDPADVAPGGDEQPACTTPRGDFALAAGPGQDDGPSACAPGPPAPRGPASGDVAPVPPASGPASVPAASAPVPHDGAGSVPDARSLRHPRLPAQRAEPLTPEDARVIASWDRDLEALTGELRRARESVREVSLPAALSASQLLRLAADPDGFARELARPMPRPPQRAARRGTRFHAWVESRFEELPLPMLGPDELPGGDRDGAGIEDERELAALKEAFERTPYAGRVPYRLEAPVQVTLAGRVVRGRIDAVYRDAATGAFEIVDWKTGRGRDADPLQLAVYRLAWAEQHGLPPESVGAAFVYVRTGEVVRPGELPGRAGLERILMSGTSGTDGTDGTDDGEDTEGRAAGEAGEGSPAPGATRPGGPGPARSGPRPVPDRAVGETAPGAG
ncbi:UvrD-helicase domain-containing protein [Streptomyces sp. HNM0645]|uniref:UvrD-helicase domain-containing protein n=1 Tax=Streptomyces sp. HNM0645 TaxID=2782343 RepID=UPI0024B86ACB|nr:UvrD-helicase domain-containing protein [Streptomyces sp. HNM0645]MDI9883541.1 UvrD-helicase domain-containing protein [Streptomyces sp. HNM0645]